MKTLLRRDFLKYSFRTAASAAALNHWFAPKSLGANSNSNYRALVCIYLAGGNDGHNMLIPMATGGGETGQQGYSHYAAVRPSSGIGIPQSLLLPVMAGTDQYGLHPSLAGIAQLYTAGKAAFVANVGSLVQPTTGDFYRAHVNANDGTIPDELLAHNQQSFQWQAADPRANQTTGWAGRMADLYYGINASPLPMNTQFSSGNLFPLGNKTLPALFGNFSSLDSFYQDAVTELLTFNSNLHLVQACDSLISSGISQQALLADAVASIDSGTNHAIAARFQSVQGALGNQLQMVATLIAAAGSLGITQQVFFVVQGGYDTHSTQLAGHAALLSELDAAVNAFYLTTQDLGNQQNVTTFTTSEFGRTMLPNTSIGTDHAWGNHQLVIGGNVRGGRLFGTFPTLRVYGPDDVSSGQTPGGITIPTTSVSQFGATLARWFGVNAGDLITIFPSLPNFPTYDPTVGVGFL